MANKFTITESAADEAGWFVAVRKTEPLYLPDNVLGQCSECKHMIQFRPDVPRNLKMVCFECAAPFIEESVRNEELDIRALPKHWEEFQEYLRKHNAN